MSKLTEIREQFRVNLRVRSNDDNNNNFSNSPEINKIRVKSELTTSSYVPKVNQSSIPMWNKTTKQYVTTKPIITSKPVSISTQQLKSNKTAQNVDTSANKVNATERRSYPIARKGNEQDFRTDNQSISRDTNRNYKTNFNNGKLDKYKPDIRSTKLSNNFGEKSRQLKTIINDNLKSLKVTEDDTLCRYCMRSFVPNDRLEKHEKVCISAYGKQRFKFDSTKQRFNGKPNEYISSYENSLKDSKNDIKKSNWRTQHDFFLTAIRSAKDENGSGSAYSRMIAATQEACNYCKRRFNSDALKRHLPICAKLYHKKVMIGDRQFRN